MDNSMRWGVIMGGFLAVVALTGSAGAQSGSSAEGSANKYSGTTGSQAVQERMYQERLREIGVDQTQESQPSQTGQFSKDRQAQDNRPSGMESGQRMDQHNQKSEATGQQRTRGSSTGQDQGQDRMMGDRMEGKGQ